VQAFCGLVKGIA